MTRAAAFVFALVITGSSGLAFEPGETILVTGNGELTVDGRATGRVYVGMALKIAAIKGDEVWLNNGGVGGWYPTKSIVTAEKGLPIVSKMIEKSPRRVLWYSARASLWMQTKHYDEAIADLDSAIGINPDDPAHYANRAIIWFWKSKYDQAIADCDETLRLNPEAVGALNVRARSFMAKGDHASALSDLTEAVRLQPKDPTAYLNRAGVLSALGKHAEAIIDLDQALQLNPRFPMAFNNRAMEFVHTGQFDRALADANEAIRLDPNDPRFHQVHGHVHHARKEYRDALADYREAVHRDEHFADGYRSLAWTLATCSDPAFRNGKLAVEYGKVACKLPGSNEPWALDALAAAFAEAGNFDAAVAQQEGAPKLAGDNAGFQQRLALYKEHKPYRE